MHPPRTPVSRPSRREKLERSLVSHVGRAIRDWNLIEEGDRIMVGLSGGKDSYALMHVLDLLRKRSPVKFTLLGVNLDQGQPGFTQNVIADWCKERGFEHRMIQEDTFSIVTDKIPEGKAYCSLCSRLRRGILYDTAESLGCSKIALGHHRDDIIETLLLNLFFAGQLKAMPPRLESDDGRNTVIRPLCYAPEEEIIEFAELMAFPILPCNLCGSQDGLQRNQIKKLLATLSESHPHLKSSVLNALKNVRPTHLLDPRLSKDAPRKDGGTGPRTEQPNPFAAAFLPLIGQSGLKLPVLNDEN